MKVRTSVEANLFEVQGHPQAWRRASDLREPEAQAAAGVERWRERAGVDLPPNKQICQVGLTYIHGIGVAISNKILDRADVNA